MTSQFLLEEECSFLFRRGERKGEQCRGPRVGPNFCRRHAYHMKAPRYTRKLSPLVYWDVEKYLQGALSRKHTIKQRRDTLATQFIKAPLDLIDLILEYTRMTEEEDPITPYARNLGIVFPPTANCEITRMEYLRNNMESYKPLTSYIPEGTFDLSAQWTDQEILARWPHLVWESRSDLVAQALSLVPEHV